VIGLVPEDLRAAMGSEGPFAGVPFLIKDIVLHMAGMRNEAGSALCAGLVAPQDSELMARFRRAGLVVVGRTATPEFGYCSTTRIAPVRADPQSLEHRPDGRRLERRLVGGSCGRCRARGPRQ